MAIIKLIIPNNLTDSKKMKNVITNTLRGIAKSVAVDFKTTTYTWKRPIDFDIKEINDGSISVGTDNKIWAMLDAGTKPHRIVPKNAKWLVFRWDGKGSYGAKTRPRFLGSKNARYPKRMNYRKVVNHPGMQAREFTNTAVDKYARLMPQIMARAIAYEMNRR